MDRVISEEQERALRAVHHDFAWLSIKKAAKRMMITPARVRRLLGEVRKIAPQMFPILTHEHRAIIAMYDEGMARESIADFLGVSLAALERRVTFLRARGVLRDRTPDQFQPWMDGDVKEKF